MSERAPTPEPAPEQLQALMSKHGVAAEVVKDVFCLLARTHTDATTAIDLALSTAFATGADPKQVAMGMSRLNENPE